MDPLITVVVPYHHERAENGMLEHCFWSLQEQRNAPPFLVLPVEDTARLGAAHTRQAGLDQVETPWVAFLDSDDWAYPDHIATLWSGAQAGLDYVFTYFTIHDRWEAACPHKDPLKTFGRQFDPKNPHQTTSTILVNVEKLREYDIRFREQPETRLIEGTTLRYGEDWDLALQCAQAGLSIGHIARRTWAWRVGLHNTSGLPGRGDAQGPREDNG